VNASSFLFFELTEFIGRQDLASRGAYLDVHIAFPQKLLCRCQRALRRGAAKIDANESIVPADQVLQLHCPIHS
jgi:hypothetical protein